MGITCRVLIHPGLAARNDEVRLVRHGDVATALPGSTLCMRNLLGWLETRLAQITLNQIKIAYVVVLFKVVQGSSFCSVRAWADSSWRPALYIYIYIYIYIYV